MNNILRMLQIRFCNIPLLLFLVIIFALMSDCLAARPDNFISTADAIKQIEKTLLFSNISDSKIDNLGDKEAPIIINKNNGNQSNNSQVQIVIVDQKTNQTLVEKSYLAYSAVLVRQYEVAMELYKQILKIKPDDKDAKFGLAVCYHNLGQYKQAKNLYYSLLKSNPANKDDVISNLLELIIEEAPNDAIYILSKLSAQNPKSAYILAKSALAYNKINKRDQAILLLNRAVNLEPTGIEYQFNLAVLYDENNDETNALKHYKNVVRYYVAKGSNGSIDIGDVKKRIEYLKHF